MKRTRHVKLEGPLMMS